MRRSGCSNSGAALLVASGGVRPTEDVLEIARGRGAAVIVSPLDTYVSGRMITLAAPCRGLMERDPLTAAPDDLVSEVSEQIKESHYGAAIVVDSLQHPVGLLTRSDIVAPARRRVILVDHAEQAQSVAGVEQAEIMEILDHHHVGSIETRVPVLATFDPVGSTSTLVVERFRQNGMEPSRTTALAMLAAVLSDTVMLNSPTTTERDRAVVEYLERVLAVDAIAYGKEMFEATSDVSGVSAERARRPRREELLSRAAGSRSASRRWRSSATRCWSASQELLEAMTRRTDEPQPPALRPDGHRRAREGDQAARRRRCRDGRASLRRRSERRHDRASRRDEPQEAGCAEAPAVGVARLSSGGGTSLTALR